ncbi:MAG: hypothetical protein H7Y60_14545 [Rhodospirillaceae bacterium]|nr:hypothetical protein [Rhodospirillales bacterium]
MHDTKESPVNRKRRTAGQVARFLEMPLPRAILDALGQSPVDIVDVGALELDGLPDLYNSLYQSHPCRVVRILSQG